VIFMIASPIFALSMASSSLFEVLLLASTL
jgi:hypothetical protein